MAIARTAFLQLFPETIGLWERRERAGADLLPCLAALARIVPTGLKYRLRVVQCNQ